VFLLPGGILEHNFILKLFFKVIDIQGGLLEPLFFFIPDIFQLLLRFNDFFLKGIDELAPAFISLFSFVLNLFLLEVETNDKHLPYVSDSVFSYWRYRLFRLASWVLS
jgi:hypothetical protein